MIYIIGIIVSFIIYISIGAILSRTIKTSSDYYVSGRQGSTLFVTGTLVASFLSTVAFMGEVGFAYEGYPIPLLILVIFNASGYVFGVFFFGRYIRRSQALTVPEYFGNRFQSKKVRVVAAVTTVLGLTAYSVAVTQGASILLGEIIEVPYSVALIIIWIVYASFTVLSGAKGVMVNDTLMFFLFTVATIISFPFIINKTGGFPSAIKNATNIADKPDLFSWHGITGENAYMGTPIEVLVWAIILGLVWGAVVAISPWQSSRYLMAKNEHVAIRSGIWAMISILFIYMALYPAVATINNLNTGLEPTEKVFIWAAMNIVPTWLGVIIVSGIFAAALSSAAAFLQLIGSSIARDIIEVSKDKPYSDNELLKISRISMVIISFIILIIGLWQPPAVMWIGYFAATLFAASWGPVAFTSIYSKTVTKEGAFWSIIAGFSGVVFGEILKYFGVSLPVFLHPVIIGIILSLVALFIGSRFGEVTAEERAYRENLLVRPVNDNEAEEMKVSRRYPVYLVIAGLFLIVFAFVYYYIPVTSAMP